MYSCHFSFSSLGRRILLCRRPLNTAQTFYLRCTHKQGYLTAHALHDGGERRAVSVSSTNMGGRGRGDGQRFVLNATWWTLTAIEQGRPSVSCRKSTATKIPQSPGCEKIKVSAAAKSTTHRKPSNSRSSRQILYQCTNQGFKTAVLSKPLDPPLKDLRRILPSEVSAAPEKKFLVGVNALNSSCSFRFSLSFQSSDYSP